MLEGLAYSVATVCWEVVVVEEVPSFEVDLTEVGSFGFSDVAKSLAREDVSPGLMIVAALTSV